MVIWIIAIIYYCDTLQANDISLYLIFRNKNQSKFEFGILKN